MPRTAALSSSHDVPLVGMRQPLGIRVSTEASIYQTLIDYRTGDMWAPKLDNHEALAVECEHFLDCVRFNKMPLSNAQASGTMFRWLL